MSKIITSGFLDKLDGAAAGVADTFNTTGYTLEGLFDAGGEEEDKVKFPEFSKLLSNYPLPYKIRPCKDKDGSGLPQIDDASSADDGQGYEHFNQCAIRMSICLMKSGFKLEGVKNVTNPKGTTKCSHGHVLGAKNLANHLKNKLKLKPRPYDGTKVDVVTKISGKTGLLYFENFEEEDSSGVMFRSYNNVHFELWNKSEYMSEFPFSQMFDATIIWFWVVA